MIKAEEPHGNDRLAGCDAWRNFLMNAGKWLAVDRGSIEVAPVEVVIPPSPPVRFALAERVPAAQLVALYLFRAHLPEVVTDGASGR